MSPKLNSGRGRPLPSPIRRNCLWWALQTILRLVFTFWLRYRACGVQRVPKTGGALLLINHQSFLDPLLVGLPLGRPVSYLARENLFTIPIVGWILRNTYVIPINRKSASTTSIKEGARRLKHGFLVGIFPEGTRARNGSVGAFKPGFVALIRRAELPVYPVGIAGANESLSRGSWLLRPRKVCVVFGEPFTREQIEELTQRGQEEKLVALSRKRIVQCHQEATKMLQ